MSACNVHAMSACYECMQRSRTGHCVCMCGIVCVCVALCVLVWHRVCMCGIVCAFVASCVLVWHCVCICGIVCVCVALCVYVWHRVCLCGIVCVLCCSSCRMQRVRTQLCCRCCHRAPHDLHSFLLPCSLCRRALRRCRALCPRRPPHNLALLMHINARRAAWACASGP